MAIVVETITVEYDVDTGKAVRKIKEVQRQTDESTKRFKKAGDESRKLTANLTKLGVAAGAVAAGILAAWKITKDLTETFAVQEKAVTSLGAALAGSGQSALLPSMLEYASALQAVTTVGDEATLSLIQFATSAGLTGEAAQQAAKDAIALSKAFNVDLNAAIKATTNAQQGNFSLLARYIPSVRTATTETEKQAVATEALARAFDVATAETETYAGAVQQLANAWGDTQELAGETLANIFEPIARTLTEQITLWNDAVTAKRNYDKALAGEGAEDGVSISAALTKNTEDLALAQDQVARRQEAINRATGRQRTNLELGLATLQNRVDLLQDERDRLLILQRIEGQRQIAAAIAGDEEAAAAREAEEAEKRRQEAIKEAERLRAEAFEKFKARRDAEIAFADAIADRERRQAQFQEERFEKEKDQIRELAKERESSLLRTASIAEDVGDAIGRVIQGQATLAEAAKDVITSVVSTALRALGEQYAVEAAAAFAASLFPPNPALAARAAGLASASAGAFAASGLVRSFQDGTPPGGFTVPPGFDGDSFPVRASSGETVSVSRAGEGDEQVTIQLILDSDVLAETTTDLVRGRKIVIRQEDIAV